MLRAMMRASMAVVAAIAVGCSCCGNCGEKGGCADGHCGYSASAPPEHLTPAPADQMPAEK